MKQVADVKLSFYLCLVVPVALSLLFASAVCGEPGKPVADKLSETSDKPESDVQKNDVNNQSVDKSDKESETERGRGHHRGRGPGRMLWQKMSEEEKTELKAFILEHFPDLYQSVMGLEETEPLLFDRKMARIVPEMIRLKGMSEDDPGFFKIMKQLHKTEFSLRRLVREYRHSDDDIEKAKLVDQIKPLVEKRFDLKQQMMEREITRLEERVDQLRKRVSRIVENRDAEVKKDLDDILRGDYRRFKEGDGPPGKGKRGQKWDDDDRGDD